MIGRLPFIGYLAAALLVPALQRANAQEADPRVEMPPDDPLMVPLIAAYGALASYSDTGTMTTTYQWPGNPALVETHSFETAFRGPRNFYFHFVRDPASGNDEFVVWCDGGPFQSWWKATGVHEIYDGGRGALAFSLGASPTREAVSLTAPFFFPQAELSGPATKLLAVTERTDAAGAKMLTAAGRQTGMGPEERPVTIELDAGTGLIARLELGTLAGQAQGLVDTIAYAMTPLANPDLPDGRFAFTPPA